MQEKEGAPGDFAMPGGLGATSFHTTNELAESRLEAAAAAAVMSAAAEAPARTTPTLHSDSMRVRERGDQEHQDGEQ